jgi:hypothetical protein
MATRKKNYDEHLRLACRDNSVAGNELGEDTTGSLDTEGKCGDVDEDDILSAFLPREDTTLNSSTICNSLIWIDALGRLFATEEFPEKLLDLGYTSRTANEYDLVRELDPDTSPLSKHTHFINFLLLHTRIFKDLLDRFHSLTEEIEIKLLKLGAGKRLREVVSVLEGFNLKARRLLGGKGALRLFYFALQLAQCAKIGRDICAGLLLVLLDKVFDDAVIKVLTTEVGITSSSQDLKDTVVDREKRNVECATSEVIDDDPGFSLGLLVKTVGDSSGCGFIDDTEDL